MSGFIIKQTLPKSLESRCLIINDCLICNEFQLVILFFKGNFVQLKSDLMMLMAPPYDMYDIQMSHAVETEISSLIQKECALYKYYSIGPKSTPFNRLYDIYQKTISRIDHSPKLSSSLIFRLFFY